MFEILLTIGGVVLGALLTAAYEHLKERRSATHVRLLLSHEVGAIHSNLKDVIELLDAFSANELPSNIRPMTIGEIAQRVEAACHRESFEACRPDLPVLGNGLMEAVFIFYDNCQQVPRSFRKIERWAGNIRHGLSQDCINGLVEKAKALEALLAA